MSATRLVEIPHLFSFFVHIITQARITRTQYHALALGTFSLAASFFTEKGIGGRLRWLGEVKGGRDT